MQGGTFAPYGDLYIENGYYKNSIGDRGGVHLFRPVPRNRSATKFEMIAESRNQTDVGGFNFAYDTGDAEEPEGIDWWDRGDGTQPPAARGQLHASMIDNLSLGGIGEDPPDDLYLKHYAVNYECEADADIDGDGLRTATSSSSGPIRSTRTRTRTTSRTVTRRLETLRTRIDGCGTASASDDWITDCDAQREIRELIDLLLANLGA